MSKETGTSRTRRKASSSLGSTLPRCLCLSHSPWWENPASAAPPSVPSPVPGGEVGRGCWLAGLGSKLGSGDSRLSLEAPPPPPIVVAVGGGPLHQVAP